MAYKQKGFTILELMIAITIMSVTMLLVTMGVIQVSRYYKQAQTKTALLNATREIHSQFSQDLQYSGYIPNTTPITVTQAFKDYSVICMGKTRYIFRDAGFNDNTFATDIISGQSDCNKAIDFSVTKSPLPPNSKVTEFTLTSSGIVGPYTLKTRFVAATSADMFEGTDSINDYKNKPCLAASLGGQFCAESSLSSTLVRKVAQ